MGIPLNIAQNSLEHVCWRTAAARQTHKIVPYQGEQMQGEGRVCMVCESCVEELILYSRTTLHQSSWGWSGSTGLHEFFQAFLHVKKIQGCPTRLQACIFWTWAFTRIVPLKGKNAGLEPGQGSVLEELLWKDECLHKIAYSYKWDFPKKICLFWLQTVISAFLNDRTCTYVMSLHILNKKVCSAAFDGFVPHTLP